MFQILIDGGRKKKGRWDKKSLPLSNALCSHPPPPTHALTHPNPPVERVLAQMMRDKPILLFASPWLPAYFSLLPQKIHLRFFRMFSRNPDFAKHRIRRNQMFQNVGNRHSLTKQYRPLSPPDCRPTFSSSATRTLLPPAVNFARWRFIIFLSRGKLSTDYLVWHCISFEVFSEYWIYAIFGHFHEKFTHNINGLW